MNDTLQNLFNNIEAKETFYHDGFYSLKLAEIFKAEYETTPSEYRKHYIDSHLKKRATEK